jgi:hypothetical protein
MLKHLEHGCFPAAEKVFHLLHETFAFPSSTPERAKQASGHQLHEAPSRDGAGVGKLSALLRSSTFPHRLRVLQVAEGMGRERSTPATT